MCKWMRVLDFLCNNIKCKSVIVQMCFLLGVSWLSLLKIALDSLWNNKRF